MAKYKLFYVDPENAAKFLGDPVETQIAPKKGDIHPIQDASYEVIDTCDADNCREEPWHKHVRVKRITTPKNPEPRVRGAGGRV